MGRVKFSNNLLTVIEGYILDHVVLHKLKHLFGSHFAVLGRIESFKKSSLVLSELSHVRENLSQAFNITLFKGDHFEQVGYKPW